jgi:hypothetical protein
LSEHGYERIRKGPRIASLSAPESPRRSTKLNTVSLRTVFNAPVRASKRLESPKQILVSALHEGQQMLTDTIMDPEEHFQDKRLQELPMRGSKASGQDAVIRRNIFEDGSAGQDVSQLILASKDLHIGEKGHRWGSSEAMAWLHVR